MSSTPTLPPPIVVWAIFAAIAVLWFANLETRRLVHPDEGRYAEIAREMAASGDWVTPRISGVKYFEKPPLQYWVTASAYRAFGVREGTARAWPALAGFLAVLAIGCTGYALGGPALGAFSALALAGTLWHAGMAQIVTLDSGLSFFLTVAFGAFVIAQRAGHADVERRGWMWLAWAALAGATLSKGPVALVLAGGSLVAYSAVTRDIAVWLRLHLVSGVALFLALTAPWFIAVARANSEFAEFFFVHEHLQRFLTTEHRRPGPWHYFVPLALAGSLPWVLILAYGARRAWREGASNAPGFSWHRFALVWAAFVFAFFSASSSKLPSYILPMFPPLALLTGWLLLTLDTRTLSRVALPGAVVAVALALIVLVGYDGLLARMPTRSQPPEAMAAFGGWLKAALTVVAAGAVLALVAFRRAARFWGAAALAVSMLGGLQLATAGYDAFSATRSTSAMLRSAQALAPFAADAPFFQVAMYDHTAPFYLGRTTTPVAFRDELGPGIDAEPTRQIPTLAAWIEQWQHLPQGYALLPPHLHAQLAADAIPMRVLARDSRRVLVSRR